MQDLVSRFIDENIRNRSNATFQTTQFMKDQLDDAKKQLDAAEDKLAAFRMQNNGRLPDQVDSNMRQLAALQSQASYLSSRISSGESGKASDGIQRPDFQRSTGESHQGCHAVGRACADHKSPELMDAEQRPKHFARPTDAVAAAL